MAALLCAAAGILAVPAGAQDALCAQVKIEIQQKLSLERQAFDAHMRITNGLDASAIQNVGINLTFQDQAGNNVIATSDPNNTSASFFVRVDSLAGIAAIDGSGSVSPKTTADIHWLIIPAVGTGGTQPQGKLYFIGATLTYTLAGQTSTVNVTPDFVTVKPQPLLALDYFLAGDVYADDPFTPKIEPPVPFTLGVRIKNVGGGTAANTAIESAQPRIVDNQQGLLIGFQILSSYVNDQPAAKTLLLNFGDIGPGTSKVGRWNMVTTLSGKFTDLQAGYTHADSLGGALTSLIQGINTHLLVHDVKVDLPGRDNVRDFLALDGDVLRVYESEGIDSAVTDQSVNARLQAATAGQYSLNFPATIGFAYVKLADPFSGQMSPGQVVRSDGKILPPENVWLSKKRNADLTWSYSINFFDVNTTGSYTVSFTSGGAASLAGFVYVDANNNGVKDAGESGIGAIAVTLSGTDNNGAGVSTTGYTNPGGSFSFVQLQPGTYSLKVAPVAGYVDGTLAVGSVGGTAAGDTITGIALGAGSNGAGYLFAKRTTTTAPPSQADLGITMSASATTVPAGSNVTFTIAASNAGPDTATSVRAIDPLPAGLSFVGATASPGTYDSASGLWSIGDLAKGATATLMLTAKVVSADAPIVNAVNVSSLVTDPNLGNNSAKVTLNPDAGSLKVTQAVLPAARFLVLASCANGIGSEDPACVSAHASFVASYLAGLGFDVKVVADTDSFRSAFRAGRYNTYWISGGAGKLTGTLAQEVREAAFRGDSVIVDGPRDAASTVLDEATGVTFAGTTLGSNLPVLLIPPSGNVPTVGDAASLALHGGQALATFPAAGSAPAIVSNHYGQGQGIVVAFDFIGTLQQSASEQALHGFIVQLLGSLAPTPPDPVVGAAYVPLTTTIQNQSADVMVNVTATLPAGVTLANTSPAPTSATATQVTWSFTLPAGQTMSVALGLRMPTGSGQYSVQTAVSKGQGASSTQVGTFSYPITVAASDQFGPKLVSDLIGLTIGNSSDRAARDAAVTALQSVPGLFTATQYENAIGQLVAAGNSLETVASLNLDAYEVAVDKWLLEAEQRWYLAPPASTYQVSGAVTLAGAGLSGVNLAATGGVTCTTSDAAGHYGCTVPAGWSGSVTPALTGNTFAPPSRNYTNVQSDQPAQDYLATAGGQPPAFTSGAAPNGTVGTAYSFTVTASGAPAPTFTVSSDALPPGLTLNAGSGLISGTPTAVGSFSGVITASNGVPPDAQQNFLIGIAASSQTITFGALSDQALGTLPFTVSATASSGLPVSFSSLTGSVCTVSGNTVTLVAVGTCTIRASQAGDANFAAAANVDQSFSVVAANTAPTITSGLPPNGSVGTAYSVTVTASGFPAPTFTVSSGALPPGLTFNGGSGLISGTPTAAGSFNGVLTASNGVTPNATQSFAITITSTPPPPAIVNGSFETPVMPSGGYQYFNGTVAGWDFAGAGIQRFGSAWGAADSGDGNQTAFIQNTGSLSQTLSLASGAYALSFLAAQRAYSIPAGGVQPLRVSVDEVPIGGLVTPPDTSFRVFTIPFTISSAGTHTLSFAGIDGSGDKSTFIDAVTLADASDPPTANFVRMDVATQGNWKGVYGGDGYAIFEDSAAYPAFARVAPEDKLDYIWDAQPASSRALQRALSGRIAACWYSPGNGGGSFSIDVNLIDLATHSVAVSMLDWDAQNRSTHVDVVDVLTGQVLDSRTLSSYQQGVYLVWNIKGHVRLQFTSVGGPNAVVSGIFFGAPLP